ncbi:MAG: hypothetical protein UV82_C0002G0122 [Candidatus Magasanikbacteria bacterium GW2011_GWD2_43_18]|uniref:Uncharacterized protein n=1 Tax=Candidatus Magasanikbacteria bacterium GW2011_GWE2_42_7 TaxID=1619052 RepID=A0A0G1BIN9_9BACT|nr:MAG: hypothetical protein UV18_C0008G0036 [Candidatus Magasanikbacteria bacterium GW2011_GWC2_42_27]KKS73202.1 MAG: hypothetical protein UV42_C0001G0017 [Candidatus Magasanikbacteria bacterium GW2011_GWE2_42_7]KKT05152.1 MAG: hypothetical protein UV82_C0002G0122 [Candidatus Magasanikbacteria bacterium GW2011_GWD2_43_18]KKT25759.1 MAG: hypothetical protein UW10_C0004G0034 [Candidatus Magasanikbacteria bacterium GW2011_GWA2_43_9]HBB38216.1 hypothetical protein [Candidatus Magasanikbacteria bac
MKKIHTFLKELYAIDPTLKAHETELIILLTRMLEQKPDVHIDDAFVSSLRKRLVGTPVPSSPSFFTHLFMNKQPAFIATGAVLSLALLVGVYHYGTTRTGMISGGQFASIFSPNEVVHRNAGAFGVLSSTESAAAPTAESVSFDTSMLSSRMPADTVVGMGGDGVDAKMMIAPAPYRYTYTYTGEPLELTDTTLPVYRRIVPTNASQALGTQLSNVGTGLVDLSSFGTLHAETISIYDNEYRITIDIANGQASIYENYDNRQDIYREATEADMLPEQQLIDIADAFLRAHNISTAGYGTPVVDMQWKTVQAKQETADAAYQTYIPNIITIIYPFQLEDHTAHDYSGLPEGMRVNVDIFTKKVNNVSNLMAGGFEASDYDVTTDSSRVISLAEQGGLNMYPWYAEESEERILELGTPTLVYIQHYLPQEGNARSYEVFIPALQFPVQNIPTDEPFYSSRIITIPLVTNILDEERDRPIPTEPPILLMKDGAEPAVEPAVR